jgi:hypothetical protein
MMAMKPLTMGILVYFAGLNSYLVIQAKSSRNDEGRALHHVRRDGA